VWGKPEIEGCMLCQKYMIQLHSIGKLHVGAGDIIGHQLIVQVQDQWMKMPDATVILS